MLRFLGECFPIFFFFFFSLLIFKFTLHVILSSSMNECLPDIRDDIPDFRQDFISTRHCSNSAYQSCHSCDSLDFPLEKFQFHLCLDNYSSRPKMVPQKSLTQTMSLTSSRSSAFLKQRRPQESALAQRGLGRLGREWRASSSSLWFFFFSEHSPFYQALLFN